MKVSVLLNGVVGIGMIAGCTMGIRDLDLENKQFEVTYNVDSTRGLDSVSRENLMRSKAVYSFSENGKGTNHTQTGMLSKDTPFTWKIEGSGLRIDDKLYAVRKQDNGFILRSDSAKLILMQQP